MFHIILILNMDGIICSITKNRARDTILYNTSKFLTDIKIHIEENNNGVKGLSQYYNECLKEFKEKDFIVFVHDDVHIQNIDIQYQIKLGLSKFDVIGVAGCLNPKIIEKNLWHWMCEDKSNWRGIAGHPHDGESFYVTSFGPTPARVAVLDGVFLAMKPKKILDAGIKFDEQFTFHHYDIDFSLQCNKNKVKLGVWPILINHNSPGLRDFNNVWTDSNNKFINKWKNK